MYISWPLELLLCVVPSIVFIIIYYKSKNKKYIICIIIWNVLLAFVYYIGFTDLEELAIELVKSKDGLTLIEDNTVNWFLLIRNLLPEFLQIEIYLRTPHTAEHLDGAYTALFYQYNMIILLMFYSILGIFVCSIILWVFKAIRKNKTYLMVNYARTLGWLAQRTGYLNYNIAILTLSNYLFALNIIQCIVFLKYNHFPHDLGQMCDGFIENRQP